MRCAATTTEVLSIKIPSEFGWELHPTYDGIELRLPCSGDEDYSELGSAFIHIGVVCLAKNRDRAADALAAFDRAVSGQTAEPCERCDGSAECKARTHVHGCFADRGDCDDPFEHASNRGQTAEKEEA